MEIKNIKDLSEDELSRLIDREVSLSDLMPNVSEIVEDVGRNGDEALSRYTEKFDGVKIEEFRVPEEEIEKAFDELEMDLTLSLERAAENIYSFHDEQRTKDLWLYETIPGVLVGQKVVPFDSVGAYVPGGRAAYPSSMLMTVVPAKVAGVSRVAVCTPPGKDGQINPLTLAAAYVAEADEVYRVGGVQAIAAMAIGTDSIKRVDKIVGPGNAYVTAAKMIVRNAVEIDFPAGPSEVLIIADDTADPALLAADMLAQAEHDPSSISVLVSTSKTIAEAALSQLKSQSGFAARKDIVRLSLQKSAILVADDLEEAMAFSNLFAPEHLEIVVCDPMGALELVRHAGSVFLGPHTPVAAGDYASGTNHVLPTSGFARFFSGLNVDHFTKKITVQKLTQNGLKEIGDDIIRLAEAEGLAAHAESVRRRMV